MISLFRTKNSNGNSYEDSCGNSFGTLLKSVEDSERARGAAFAVLQASKQATDEIIRHELIVYSNVEQVRSTRFQGGTGVRESLGASPGNTPDQGVHVVGKHGNGFSKML